MKILNLAFLMIVGDEFVVLSFGILINCIFGDHFFSVKWFSDGTSSSTLRPRNSTHAGAKTHSSDVASSASVHMSTIFKSLLPSGSLTTSSWEEEGIAGQNTDNLWRHIGIGGVVGLVVVLLLSVVSCKLYAINVWIKFLYFQQSYLCN